jgi:hypothetical protein
MFGSGLNSKEKDAINERILHQLRNQAEKQKMNKEQAQKLYDRLLQAQAKREASVGMMRVQSILKDTGQQSKSPSQVRRAGLLHKDLPDRTIEIIQNRKNRIQEMKFLRNQIQEEKNKEECTFTPKINNYSIRRSTSRNALTNQLRQSTSDLSAIHRQEIHMSPSNIKSPTRKNMSPVKSQNMRTSVGNFTSNISTSVCVKSPRRSVSKTSLLQSKEPVSQPRQRSQTPGRARKVEKGEPVSEDNREIISVSQLCKNFELMGTTNPHAKKHPLEHTGNTTTATDNKHSVSIKKAKVGSLIERANNFKRPKESCWIEPPTESGNMTPRLDGAALQALDSDKENCFRMTNKSGARSPFSKKIESPLTFAKSPQLNVTFDGQESAPNSPGFIKSNKLVSQSNPFELASHQKHHTRASPGPTGGKRAVMGRRGIERQFQ